MLRRVRFEVVLALVFASVRVGAAAEVTIHEIPYHDWHQAFAIKNKIVEAIVVPTVGRVMQFKFLGEETGPWWENRDLDGKSPNSQSSEWINFGGDKTWPAEQSEWAKITGRGWPPPKAFDSMPVDAEIQGETLLLTSKIDPQYGIQTERRIKLHASAAEMEIETTYRKVEGQPVRVGVWVITQLKDPERVFMPISERSLFPSGYNKQSEILPAQLSVADRWLSCTRSTRDSTKIGSDAGDLIWADARWVVHIHAPREAAGEFPDQGSSAEIYTNPDPKAYVELETLGPMKRMERGDTISRKQRYRLYRRGSGPLEQQVRELIKQP